MKSSPNSLKNCVFLPYFLNKSNKINQKDNYAPYLPKYRYDLILK